MTVADIAVRTKRVKEARDDAKKEIADYKANKEEEYKKFEAEVRVARLQLSLFSLAIPEKTTTDSVGMQHSKGNQEAEEEANKEAEKQIKDITASGKKNQGTVVKSLLSAVFDVKPVPPE